jgi:transcription initiation factor IIF auxiliary subunit
LRRTSKVRAPGDRCGHGQDADARTVFKKPPFRIDEKGWGEFDMSIVLTAVGKGGDHTLDHDLNFHAERYEAKHQVVSAPRIMAHASC